MFCGNPNVMRLSKSLRYEKLSSYKNNKTIYDIKFLRNNVKKKTILISQRTKQIYEYILERKEKAINILQTELEESEKQHLIIIQAHIEDVDRKICTYAWAKIFFDDVCQ
jgi:hypothetical protein